MRDFAELPQELWIAHNELAFAVRDRSPVSTGHALVIPRRVVPTWFETTEAERLALMSLVDEVRALLDHCHPRPDGYNVGFDAGESAGQKLMHLHVHVIPRYRGETPSSVRDIPVARPDVPDVREQEDKRAHEGGD